VPTPALDQVHKGFKSHLLLPSPAFRERRHRGLARRLIAVRRRAVLVVAEPDLGPAVVERPKTKKVRQTAPLQCFLLVALRSDFNEELRRCSRNGLCQCRGAASGKERATDLGNDLEGVYGPLVPWSSGIIHRCVQFVH
jgi:hypothetical protein